MRVQSDRTFTVRRDFDGFHFETSDEVGVMGGEGVFAFRSFTRSRVSTETSTTTVPADTPNTGLCDTRPPAWPRGMRARWRRVPYLREIAADRFDRNERVPLDTRRFRQSGQPRKIIKKS